MGLLEAWIRWVDRLARWNMAVAAAALAVMAVLINVEVFSRYFFGVSTLIADEYSGYLFVVCTMFGFAYALNEGYFLKVDTVVARLSPRSRAWLLLFASVLALVLTAVCLREAGQLAYDSWRFKSSSNSASRTPLVYPQGLLALGLLTLCFAFIRQAALAVLMLRDRPDRAS